MNRLNDGEITVLLNERLADSLLMYNEKVIIRWFIENYVDEYINRLMY
jgi:hypothetical protein